MFSITIGEFEFLLAIFVRVLTNSSYFTQGIEPWYRLASDWTFPITPVVATLKR